MSLNSAKPKAVLRPLRGRIEPVSTLFDLTFVAPGVIKTEIFRHVVQIWWMKLLSGLVRPFLKSPKEGAQTTLYCCLDEKIAEHSGRYYSDCKEKQASRNARDDEAAKKLWEVSLKMVGLNVEEDQ